MKKLILLAAMTLSVTTAFAQEPTTLPVTTEEPLLLNDVEQMPSFNGAGVNEFREWVYNGLQYPELAQQNSIQGLVLVGFIIERDGSLTNIEILRSPDASLSTVVTEKLSQSPVWTPGIQDGKTVRVKYVLPVAFKLE